MSIRGLGEAIVLQALEDLFIEDRRQESARFFGGEGFRVCAELAGLGVEEQIGLLRMVEPRLARTRRGVRVAAMPAMRPRQSSIQIRAQ